MKKATVLLTVALLLALSLTSCEVHFGDQKYEVEWYVIAIPTVLIIISATAIAGAVLSKNTYICPECGHKFRPKWWQAALSLHVNSDRVFKCPNCGHKGFCRKED